MSSAGGGSGVGGGGGIPQGFQQVDGALVQLESGAEVDLGTAEGVALLEAELSPEQLAELDGNMRQTGLRRVGQTFVPSDDFEIRQELGIVGPASPDGGTDLDAEINEQVFKPAGIPNPYNANTTEALLASMIGKPPTNGSAESALTTGKSANSASAGAESTTGKNTFDGAVESMSQYMANPTPSNMTDFQSRMQALQLEQPNGNIMEVLFLVFRESIKATNEDKKYFLIKLQEFNKMAEKVSEYLSTLVERSQALAEKAEGQKYPDKVHINVEVKSFDTTTLNAAGEAVSISRGSRSMDRASLNDTIKDVESVQETIRNKRQMASTSFQNFDQKSNQLYNLMASVLKAMNEMRSGAVRNML